MARPAGKVGTSDAHALKRTCFKEFRFSIGWPRILPQGTGEVNQLGVQHYHDVIDECHKYGIEPVVTLYHFDLPQALQDKYGGWASRQCVDDFLEYCRVCFAEYGKKVKYFLTINEQNMMVLFEGDQYEGKGGVWQANHYMLVALAARSTWTWRKARSSSRTPRPRAAWSRS